jgi:hypothetical protein
MDGGVVSSVCDGAPCPCHDAIALPLLSPLVCLKKRKEKKQLAALVVKILFLLSREY